MLQLEKQISVICTCSTDWNTFNMAWIASIPQIQFGLNRFLHVMPQYPWMNHPYLQWKTWRSGWLQTSNLTAPQWQPPVCFTRSILQVNQHKYISWDLGRFPLIRVPWRKMLECIYPSSGPNGVTCWAWNLLTWSSHPKRSSHPTTENNEPDRSPALIRATFPLKESFHLQANLFIQRQLSCGHHLYLK